MKYSILVSGGAGFIGSNFIHFIQYLDLDIDLVNVDLLTYAGNLQNLADLPHPERYHFHQADICEQELMEWIIRKYEINTIINFAAETHVDRSIHDPQSFIRSNINGTFSLLEAAKKIWLQENSNKVNSFRFHQISTDEVFGTLKADDPPFNEKTPYSPNSPYSASKAAADHLVIAYGKTYGLPVSVSHCTNNYGPYQFPEKLIPLMILNALEEKPLPVYGDGLQIRDWLFVEDHCRAIWDIIVKADPGDSFMVGGETNITNLQVVRYLCQFMDAHPRTSSKKPYDRLITFVDDRPGHDRRYAVDCEKIRSRLGWQPRNDLKAGLEKTIRWYLENDAWIADIRERNEYQGWLELNYANRRAQ